MHRCLYLKRKNQNNDETAVAKAFDTASVHTQHTEHCLSLFNSCRKEQPNRCSTKIFTMTMNCKEKQNAATYTDDSSNNNNVNSVCDAGIIAVNVRVFLFYFNSFLVCMHRRFFFSYPWIFSVC